MRRSNRVSAVSAALVVCALFAGPLGGSSARADDKPAGDGVKVDPKPNGKGDGKVDGNADPKKDPAQVARQEKAKKLVQELETTIAILKAAKTVDAESMKALEKALEDARALAKPMTLAELTDDEKLAIGDELRKQFEKDGVAGGGDKGAGDKGPGEGGGPGDEWRKQALANAFKDVDATEEEQLAAGKVINEWFEKSRAAQFAGESKRVSDLKRARDEQLEKSLGRKKAQKVINNLNSMSRGR